MQSKQIRYKLLALSLCASSFHSSGTVFAGINPTDEPHQEIATTITANSPKMRAITLPSATITRHVAGYLDQQYIQGEVTISGEQQKTIEGYIYLNDHKQYIYGEIHQNTISAYDQQGNHYLLTFEK